MSNTTQAAPKVTVVKEGDTLPPGLLPEGVSTGEAAAELYDLLGSDGEEFSEEADESEQSTSDDDDVAEGSDEDEDESDELDEDDDGLDGDPDEDEDSDDESEDGDEADDESESLPDDTLIDGVPLPGGETTEVTLAELKAGYSRTEDYTRKRQRDAAEHAEVMTEARGIRSEYAERLVKLKETLTQLGPKAPDAELRKTNPGEYAAQAAEYQAYQDTLNKVDGAQDAISAEAAQELEDAKQDYVQLEWGKVVDAVPAWSDQEVATAELAALRKYAMEEKGFSAEEIDSLADSRLLLMLKDNFDMAATQTKGKKKVAAKKKKAKKRLGPGSARLPAKRGKKRQKQQQSADQRAATTGSVSDAAAAIELSLGDDL
jgi:hypothetical protein